jgi:glycosyltransferase involved in cell wall biosynthesis
LVDEIGVERAQITRVFNGLDLSQFPYASPATRPPRIIGVGRLVEKKGFDLLVEGCAKLAERGTPIPCEIIGSGPLEAALVAQINALGMGEWITLRGPQPQQVVKESVQGGALFVAPCVVGSDGNRDGLPTVLLEAMALGTPVVSTDVTGIPEILHHEQTGLMVAQNDAEALAAAMLRLVEDGALREQLALAARARIESDFDIHRNAAHIRALYAAAQARVPQPAPAAAQPSALRPHNHDPVPVRAEVRA